MDLSLEQIAALPLPMVRSFLPDWIASHVDAPPVVLDGIRRDVRARIAASTEEEMRAMQAVFFSAGEEYRLYPASPFARDCTRAFMAHLLDPGEVEGRAGLEQFLGEGPTRRMIVCNHLSYTDTQITDVILLKHGLSAVADRLVAIAGPKVYTDPWRRMAAIALNTRKTAQSSAVASEQDALGPREIAMIARDTIADCERLMDEGWIVLLYPEGTRSRTGRLQTFLRAAARYASLPGLQILPMVQTGTEQVYPIGSTQMYPGHVRATFGQPFRAEDHPGKIGSLTEVHHRMAGLLPERYRPDGELAVA
jgi:1-acyl-sn-glycerol-3-phosphate acyltransferase